MNILYIEYITNVKSKSKNNKKDSICNSSFKKRKRNKYLQLSLVLPDHEKKGIHSCQKLKKFVNFIYFLKLLVLLEKLT